MIVRFGLLMIEAFDLFYTTKNGFRKVEKQAVPSISLLSNNTNTYFAFFLNGFQNLVKIDL